MKKILIAVAVVATAALANATAFTWKLQTGTDYSGMNVYALTGTTAASVLTACQSTTASDWTDTFTGYTSVAVSGSGNRAGAASVTEGIAANDNLVWVIVDGDVAEGSKYWVVNDYSIPASSVYEPPAAGTQLTINLATQGTAGSGTFTAVPEPTSGLLVLLGMAGLALKRKRA